MRYSDDLIEEIRMKNDIVDVISGYVKLQRKGSSYFGLCPFHNEKSPSFSVSPGKQMYYCFGCGAGGNVFTFLMEYENFTFPEALEMLRRIHQVKPVVQFDRQLGDGETSFIGYDCYHDCRAAVEYLIECGHRSIGLIRASNDSEAAPSSRLAGYFDALKANGLAYDPRYTIVYDVFKPDLANDVVEILSSSGCPSAYFAVNSVYVPRFMRKVLFVNKSVPRDFSLICYDLPDTLTNFSQEITYVSEPTREVVAAAAEQLLREIARRPEAPRQQLLRGHFVYGESCRELRAV